MELGQGRRATNKKPFPAGCWIRKGFRGTYGEGT